MVVPHREVISINVEELVKVEQSVLNLLVDTSASPSWFCNEFDFSNSDTINLPIPGYDKMIIELLDYSTFYIETVCSNYSFIMPEFYTSGVADFFGC